MIYALTYTHRPSHDLVRMLNRSLTRYGVPHMAFIDNDCDPVDGAVNMFKHNYTGGHGWHDSMSKLEGYRIALEHWNIKDDDWLIDMDDDTVMVSDGWLKVLDGYSPFIKDANTGEIYEWVRYTKRENHSLAGIQHDDPYPTAMGQFAHMSGACLCMRGWVVKKLLTLDWTRIKKDMENWNLPFVWDLVISYGCGYAGAESLNMSKILDLSIHFEDYVSHRKGHFFHFNGVWKTLGGLPLKDGRYSIPGVLKQLNIEL